MIKKTINEKIKKDLGLLKKVWKQERLRGDFWFWKLFWESWELFSARHEHSISVPDSTSLNHSLQTSDIGTTLQPLRYVPPRCRHLPQTGNLQKTFLLIKCLELGVVMGMSMAFCSVTNISH